MLENKKILIVGLGLLGGSYAARLTEKGYYVGAITRSQSSIDFALKNNYIKSGTTEVSEEYVKELKEQGTLTFDLTASLEGVYENTDGKRKVVIYLPADATVVVKDFEIDAAFVPAKKGEKILWLGDSITQGFGPLRSAQTYVSVANRILKYDIINQGIGGYVYDKKSLLKMEGYKPEKLIVALGTNQYGCETMKDIEEYYERLMEVYGNDMPVLCITPLWRDDVPNGYETLIRFCENVKKIAGSYKNVKVVDGFRLVPHLHEYFLDKLHPNCFGAEVYGRNLVREIERLGF